MIKENKPNKQPIKYILYVILRILIVMGFFDLFISLMWPSAMTTLNIIFIWVIALPVLVKTIIDYEYSIFTISDDKLTLKSGFLRKKSKSVSFDKIQNVETDSTILCRLFGISKVKIWTSSPGQMKKKEENKPDISIFILRQDIEHLESLINKKDFV